MIVTDHGPAGTANFRDVVQTPGMSSLLQPGRLFRSDSVHALPESGIAQVRRLGIGTVVDLRSPVEAHHNPSPFPVEGVHLTRVPLELLGIHEASREDLTLESLYSRILGERGGGLARAVRSIARARPGAVLVHCTAGKDRTGLAVALALSAVGVPLPQILDDYAVTEQNLRGEWTRSMVGALEAGGVEVDTRLLRILAASPSESLASAFRTHVLGPWGDASSYLLAHGLTRDDLTALHDRLLDPTPHGTGD